MTVVTDGKEESAEGSSEFDALGSPSNASASSVSAPARYYFNLTNGDVMIRDGRVSRLPVFRRLLSPLWRLSKSFAPKIHPIRMSGEDGGWRLSMPRVRRCRPSRLMLSRIISGIRRVPSKTKPRSVGQADWDFLVPFLASGPSAK